MCISNCRRPSQTLVPPKEFNGSLFLGKAHHFGGLWEAAVKSCKTHLRKVVDTIESSLNSRPLVLVLTTNGEPLTPGHFIIGLLPCALPEPVQTTASPTLLRRWHLCQQPNKAFLDSLVEGISPIFEQVLQLASF